MTDVKAIQISKQNDIDAKLDKIKELMEEVLMELKENAGDYPPESQIKAHVLKRLSKLAEEIASGKRNTVKFRNIQELDRIVSGYKA